ncbi:MAG: Phosphoserine phosphatase 1 [Verrucomicrobiota bacterium]|jgi:broad specificity phosphatase PhoE
MIHPVRLVLLRHGEVEERYHRVFGGRIDMNLSPRGHEQAAALAGYLRHRPLDAVYVSPLRRAQQTLAPILSHCPQPPVTLPGLREVDFGDWTGLSWEQVHARFQISAFQWLDQIEEGAIPGGESAADFRARVAPCLEQILRDHPGQTVGVVCHGGVIRMALSILLELPLPKTAGLEIDYASVTRVERHAHKTELTLLNFAPWRDLP